MYENYGNYIIFFIVSSVIFTIMGLILRWYTGRDWFKIITRIIVIGIVIVVMFWAFTVENETTEQLTNNILFLVNILLYVFIPLIIGEVVSSRIMMVLNPK
jgi:hypothetical protein